MAKSNLRRGALSARLRQAVSEARGCATLPGLYVSTRRPGSEPDKVEAPKGGALDAGAQFRNRVARTNLKSGLIRTSTSANALRRHVAQAAAAAIDSGPARDLIRLKARDDLAPPQPATGSDCSASVPAKAAPEKPWTDAPITYVADLGRVIRLMRARRRMTQAALAHAADVDLRAILDLEAGKPTVLIGEAIAVARALGIILTATAAGRPSTTGR